MDVLINLVLFAMMVSTAFAILRMRRLFAVVMLARRSPFFYRNGFYLMVGAYAFQRFWWEFLKPYATPFGPFNTFHFLCAGLMAYALVMLLRNQNVRT